jgi:hypothetical protein
MKKPNKKPLSIAKETMKNLTERELDHAGGGRAYVTTPSYYSPCTYTPTVTCWPG